MSSQPHDYCAPSQAEYERNIAQVRAIGDRVGRERDIEALRCDFCGDVMPAETATAPRGFCAKCDALVDAADADQSLEADEASGLSADERFDAYQDEQERWADLHEDR